MDKLFPLYAIFLLSLFFFPACNSNLESVTETDEYGNTLSFERRKKDFAREGWAYTTNPDGILIEAAYYRNDTLDGQRILFTEKGDTNIVETYRRGIFDGEYRLYHENGTLKQKGRYVNNEMTGNWEGFYDNGQLKERVKFERNMENGPFIEYHPNGQLAAKGAYLDGDFEHGELKIYDENGEALRIMQCDKGRCKTIWSAEEKTE